MGIDGQLNIPLFHPLTAGDNRYRCTKPQPIDRPLGIFNIGHIAQGAGHCGIVSSIGLWLKYTPISHRALSHPRGVPRRLAHHPHTRRCLSLLHLKSLRWMVFATRWSEARDCSALDRRARVPCSFPSWKVPYWIGYQTNNRSEMMGIDTYCEPQWIGFGMYRSVLEATIGRGQRPQ